MMLLAVAALIALERYGRRRQGFTGLDRAPGQRAGASRLRVRSDGLRWQAASFRCCWASSCRSSISLARRSLRGLLIGFDPALGRHTLSTVLLAGCATVLILAIGFGAAFALRLIRRRSGTACIFIAGLGYAVPGTVLALGLLVAAGRDRRSDRRRQRRP